MKVPVTTRIAIKLDILLQQEKIEQEERGQAERQRLKRMKVIDRRNDPPLRPHDFTQGGGQALWLAEQARRVARLCGLRRLLAVLPD